MRQALVLESKFGGECWRAIEASACARVLVLESKLVAREGAALVTPVLA